jgi:hypothetical protein
MRVNSPLFSQEAKGTIGDVITFSKRKTGQMARYQRKQKDVLTISRTEQQLPKRNLGSLTSI